MARGTRANATRGPRGCDAGPARMRRGTQSHVAEPRKPTRCKVEQTRGRGHTSPRGRPGGATWHEGGLESRGPTG